MSNPRATTALAALLVLAAGCTSSGSPGRSTAAPTSSPRPVISSAPGRVTATAPVTSGRPTTLEGLRGAILLLGSNPDTADVFEVTTGAFRALTRLPGNSRVSDVTADAKHVVITDDARTHADHIDVVDGGELADLGLGAAFGPSLSTSGQLAYVALEGGSPTPGITKPTSFVVGVRDSLRGVSRVAYRSTSSVASPQWIGPHALVVAASNGQQTQLVRVDTGTGATTVLTTVASSDALDLTAGPSLLTAWDGSRAMIVSTTGHTLGYVAAAWRPLCWLPAPSTGASLLVARGGRLATVAVTAGRAALPVAVASAPPGLSVYAASCSRVRPG